MVNRKPRKLRESPSSSDREDAPEEVKHLENIFVSSDYPSCIILSYLDSWISKSNFLLKSMINSLYIKS